VWKGKIEQKQNSTSATCNSMEQCNCLITEYAISEFSRKEKWNLQYSNMLLYHIREVNIFIALGSRSESPIAVVT